MAHKKWTVASYQLVLQFPHSIYSDLCTAMISYYECHKCDFYKVFVYLDAFCSRESNGHLCKASGN